MQHLPGEPARTACHAWLNPTGTAVLWVESTPPEQCRVCATDLLPPPPTAGPSTWPPSGGPILAATLPAGHIVLAAGVVTPHHPFKAPLPPDSVAHHTSLTPPRSVLVTISQVGSAPSVTTGAAVDDAASPTRLRRGLRAPDSQHDRGTTAPQAIIHVWAVDLNRSLLPAAGAGAPEHPRTAPRESTGDNSAGAAAAACSAGACSLSGARVCTYTLRASGLSLQEVGRMLVPAAVHENQGGAQAVSTSTGAVTQAVSTSTGAVTQAAGLRCCLAAEGRGAWAALQVAPTRVLLLDFSAAISEIPPPLPADRPTSRQLPPLPADVPAAAGTSGGAEGASDVGGQPVVAAVRCIDIDLSAAAMAAPAAAAAPGGGSVLSCCVYGNERVVLDFLVGPSADGGVGGLSGGGGGFAGRATGHKAAVAAAAVAAASSSGGARRGQDVLLRLSLDVGSRGPVACCRGVPPHDEEGEESCITPFHIPPPAATAMKAAGAAEAAAAAAAAAIAAAGGERHNGHWMAPQPLKLAGRATACCPLPGLPPWPPAPRHSCRLASGPARSNHCSLSRRGLAVEAASSYPASVAAAKETAGGVFAGAPASPAAAAGGAAAAMLAAAAAAPAVLVGCDGGRLQLLTPESFAVAAAATAGAMYGSTAGTAGVSMKPSPAPPPSSVSRIEQPSAVLPGPVLSICRLPSLLHPTCRDPSIISTADRAATSEDCCPTAVPHSVVHPNPPGGGTAVGRSRVTAAAVGVLCGDTRRSLVVLAVRQWWEPPLVPFGSPAELRVRAGSLNAAMATAAAAVAPRPIWSLQRLLKISAVQVLLPVPLSSALTLAVMTVVAGGALAVTAAAHSGERGGGGGDGGALLVSVGAVAALGNDCGAGAATATAAANGNSNSHCTTHGADVEMEDVDHDGSVKTEEEEDFETGCEGWAAGMQRGGQPTVSFKNAVGAWGCQTSAGGGGGYEGGRGVGARGGCNSSGERTCVAVGPLRLGPWERAVLFPVRVRPLPPQVLLPGPAADTPPAPAPAPAHAGAGAGAGADAGPGRAAASVYGGAEADDGASGSVPPPLEPTFAAGSIPRVLVAVAVEDPTGEPRRSSDSNSAQQSTRGPQQQQGGGSGGDDAVKGMAKVLAHMARRWDTAVHRATEQRAALGRMDLLTRQAEGLISDMGQGLLPTRGSLGARPPSRAAGLLDSLLDLEEKVLGGVLGRGTDDAAVAALAVRRERTAAAAADGVSIRQEGMAAATSEKAAAAAAAVAGWLDELLGPETSAATGAGTGAARGNVAAAVKVVGRSDGSTMWCRKQEEAPAPGSGGGSATAAVPSTSREAGGDGCADMLSEAAPRRRGLEVDVESLSQALRGGEWVLQALLRVNDNVYDNTSRDGSPTHGLRGGAGHVRTRQPPVQLDDVALLPYCRTIDDDGDGGGNSGGSCGVVPLPSSRGRWAVLQRAQHRVVTEVAVPLGDLLALAAGGGGAGGRHLRMPSQHRRLGEAPGAPAALGPPPSLLHSDDDDDDESEFRSEDGECSDATVGDTPSKREARADGGFGMHGGAAAAEAAAATGCTTMYELPYGRLGELRLGAMVRLTARLGSEAALLQCRTLDTGTVHVDLDRLLAAHPPESHLTPPPPPLTPPPPMTASCGVGFDAGGDGGGGRVVDVDGGGGGGDSRTGPALGEPRSVPPAVGDLLAGVAGTRSMLLLASTSTLTSAPREAEPQPARAAGCAPSARGPGAGAPAGGCPDPNLRRRAWCAQEAAGGEPWLGSGERVGPGCAASLRSALAGWLGRSPGFRRLHAGCAGGGVAADGAATAANPVASGDLESLGTGPADQLVWDGPLGWRCGVSLLPYGTYGCEVQLSYMDGDAAAGGGSGGWCSGASLDLVQRLVTEAAAKWCEKSRRRLSVHCPSPLCGPALELLDTAVGCLQRAVDASLGLLERALLAQHHQIQIQIQNRQPIQRQLPQQQKQQHKGQEVPQQQQLGGGKELQKQSRQGLIGRPLAVKGFGGGGAQETAVGAADGPPSARDLQAQLQEVLQLQLHLSCAMEGLLLAA